MITPNGVGRGQESEEQIGEFNNKEPKGLKVEEQSGGGGG